MINYKVMSMCPNFDYCKGWNDAVKEIKENNYVVAIDEKINKAFPHLYPIVGTVGKIISDNGEMYEIQWEEGSTSENDIFWAKHESVIKLII